MDKSKSSRHHSSKRHLSASRKSHKRPKSSYKGDETPPLLDLKHISSMDSLMKKRESLKRELKDISKQSLSSSKSKNSENKKYEHRSKQKETKTSYKSKTKQKELKNSKSANKQVASPANEYGMLDSEDEEHIIELRRKKRKMLIEQLVTRNDSTENLSDNNKKSFDDSNENVQSLIETNKINSTEASNHLTDMFAEDDFKCNDGANKVTQDTDSSTQLIDNWDDADSYYIIKTGDMLDCNKYTIKTLVGQGVFANVVKAQDNKENREVAIKIMRNNDLMYSTGLKEIITLAQLNKADPDNKHHCIKMITHFTHKRHLCLVLESMHMDLRSVIKKYGRNNGLNLKALMSYTRQLILALRLLKKIGVIHADIKPDNILVNEKKNVLKLCDFGSAFKINENEPTPYLVSRFYRAPEVILGIPSSYGVDLWSTACTIYEIATSKILFTGSSNNKMLKCFMDLKGRIPTRLIRKGKFKDQHFDYNNNFLLHKKDEFTGREKYEVISNVTIVRDLNKELKKSFIDMTSNEEQKVLQLKDLLHKMLMLDPGHRLSLTDSIKHPFVQETLQK
ncbi:unnamed protein product [Leptidea sinapis]|uniref:non-specific serine/threonine protein kinase n=1 Tax=Leptidea sinapis TaxID=189913 RepID=A0A5E4QE76_9NEOP|nr:unnamed protein product [Leptidea sinapis]